MQYCAISKSASQFSCLNPRLKNYDLKTKCRRELISISPQYRSQFKKSFEFSTSGIVFTVLLIFLR